MISKKTQYAVNALLFLTKAYGKGPVLIAELADKERIPKKFLQSILLELKNEGILASKKGKGGGYVLARPPETITVGQVIQVLEGPLATLPCLNRTAPRTCERCTDQATCGIRIVMKEVVDATAKVLDGTSLAEIRRQVEGATMTFFI